MITLPTTTDELTTLLNFDAVARAEARILANIARHAQTLFTDGGYVCRTYTENLAVVESPKGDKYTVWYGEETGEVLPGIEVVAERESVLIKFGKGKVGAAEEQKSEE